MDNEYTTAMMKTRSDKAMIWLCAVLSCILVLAIGVFALFALGGPGPDESRESVPTFAAPISDHMLPPAKFTVVDEECFLDRDRNFHLTCQIIPQAGESVVPEDLTGTEVGYKLYGPGDDRPWSFFSAYSDAAGYVDVIVIFEGLDNTLDDQHVIGSVDNLRSYDVYMVDGDEMEHGPAQHDGEVEFARTNWIANESWYHVDYRSWGSRAAAARHTGHSPDPEVRNRFTWYTAPQYGPDANADGSCNYWGNRKWILVHDYSWMGQVWLTMSPGAIYYIDGVEYEAEGVINIDRNNTTEAVYAITGRDPLIIQTCDGWVYVRIIWGYPTAQKRANAEASAQQVQMQPVSYASSPSSSSSDSNEATSLSRPD